MQEHRGIAMAIVSAIVGFTMTLAAVLIAVGWLGLTIYAIVKWIGGGSDEAGETELVLATMFLVTTLVALLAGGIWFLGRPMVSRKRQRLEAPGL